MTTITPPLKENERAALKTVNAIFPEWAQQPIASEETWHALHKLGLIWWDSFKHLILITPAGRAYLAANEAGEATAAGGEYTWPNKYYRFDYIPYALRVTDGDNEHPTNYGVVRVYDKTNLTTETFVEAKEITRLEATIRELESRLRAADGREKALVSALKPFADACERLIIPDAPNYSVENYGIVEKAQGKFLGVKEIFVKDLRQAKAAYQQAESAVVDDREGGSK